MFENLLNLKSRSATRHIEIRMHWKVMGTSELTGMLNLLGQISPGKPFHFGLIDGDRLRHLTENPILDCLLPGVSYLRLRSSEDVMLGS